jgi:hypothetical protein
MVGCGGMSVQNDEIAGMRLCEHSSVTFAAEVETHFQLQDQELIKMKI